MTKITRGAVTRTAGAYDGMMTGSLSISLPPQAIHPRQRPIMEVLIQNDPGSAVNVFVGDRGRQEIILIPGASITIPINDLNNVWVRTAGAVATVNYLAMT